MAIGARRVFALALLSALGLGACLGLSEVEKPRGTGGTSATGGSAGSGATGSCGQTEKVCNGKCVTKYLVENGCAGPQCTCNLPHATAKCSSIDGLCAVDTCEPGWENCDKNTTVGAASGCEAQIAVDPKACGPSCVDCIATKGPNWTCKDGACKEDICANTGKLDCDGVADCETDKNDIDNCGFCGNACSFSHATASCDANSSSATSYACNFQCQAPWADCDGIASNGCETDLSDDPAHCGSCSNACDSTNGTPGCSSGKCQIYCSSGWDDCTPGGGCETPVNTANNCGSCGVTCYKPTNGTSDCSTGTCQRSCNSGFGNCDGSWSNGCELSLKNSSNCGACGTACPTPTNGTADCSSGTCQRSCNSGFANCDNSWTTGCESLKTGSNCGACGAPCTDPANGAASCATGSCVRTCNSGFYNCDGSWSNGCETDPNTSSTNCGNCGTVCTGGKTCQSGTCACPAGKKDCAGTCQYCCVSGDCGAGYCCTSGTCVGC